MRTSLLVAALAFALPAASGETTFLGVACDSKSEGRGVRVDRVIAGSAAERAGIAPGDRILAIDGEEVATYDDLLAEIRAREIGQAVLLVVSRDGRRRYAIPVLAPEERPGFEPIPLAEPLVLSFEALWAAGAADWVAGRREECAGASSALDEAVRRHLAESIVVLDEVAARGFEDRARAAQESALWFADRAGDDLPVLGDPASGSPCPVELEVVAVDPPRFAVRSGTLSRSDRVVEALRRREGAPSSRVSVRLAGRDRVEGGADLLAGDRLEWVEIE